MKKNMYVEIHALQDMPPNCLNRDENGSPKTALYGGAERSYVSSQAWKKAIREYFKKEIDHKKIGCRTLDVVKLVQEDLQKRYSQSEAESKALTKTLLADLGLKAKEGKTAALLAVSEAEIRAVSDFLIQKPEINDKKKLRKILREALRHLPSVDTCFFGRMSAEASELNIDAACQIAPAISVNEIQMDTDFFTAVDDLKKTSGAGMMGTKEFTSGVLYRYGNVAVQALMENIDEDIPQLVSQFVKTFIESMPSGMQNGFAAHTLPYAVYITVREDRPLSFVSAFECPVKEKGNGFRKVSAECLNQEINEVYSDWATPPAAAWIVGKYLSGLAPQVKLDELYKEIENMVEQRLNENKG